MDALRSTLVVAALAVVVSMLVAVVIRLIVGLLGRADRPAPVPAVPAAPTLSVAPGVPPEHVAAIAAAVDSVFGWPRLLHIEPSPGSHGWAAQGRQAQHSSHQVRP